MSRKPKTRFWRDSGRNRWLVYSAAKLEPGTRIVVPRQYQDTKRVVITKYLYRRGRGHLHEFTEIGSKPAAAVTESAARHARVEKISKQTKAERRRAAIRAGQQRTRDALIRRARTCAVGLSQDAAEAMERQNRAGTVAYECARGDHWHVKQR